jgi:hypothetical protein
MASEMTEIETKWWPYAKVQASKMIRQLEWFKNHEIATQPETPPAGLPCDKHREAQAKRKPQKVLTYFSETEAVRVRAIASAELDEDAFNGYAAMAVETGTHVYAASLLICCGLASRVAAIKAVGDETADCTDARGMRRWIFSGLSTLSKLVILP